MRAVKETIMSRRSLLIALGMLLLFCARNVWAQDGKTLGVMPRTGDYAGQKFYTNSFAVIIGIAQYQNLPKDKQLHYADKDAADLRDLLVRSYGFLPENVTVLLNEQATQTNILASLSALASINRVHHDDRILVFFSGHGQTVKRANGGEIGFLIPYNARVNLTQIDDPQPYLDTCIKMQQIWDAIDLSPAKHSLLLVDACFGGLLINGKALGGKPSPGVVANLLSHPAQQVMTAGTATEEALELPDKGHGAFAYALLEELRAQASMPDNVFLASGLYAAVKVPVANLAEKNHRTLTPQFGNYGATVGDFVFLTTSPRTVPPLKVATPDATKPDQNPVAQQDIERPHFTKKRLLIVTYAPVYHHPSIANAERVIGDIGQRTNLFSVDYCRTAEDVKRMLAPASLNNYDGVFFANTTGNLGIPDMPAFLDWIKAGHAFLGAHAATDTYHPNQFNGDTSYTDMIGGEFKAHGHLCEVQVVVEDQNHPSTSHMGAGFRVVEEVYEFQENNRSRVHVLLSLNTHPNDGHPTAGQPDDLLLAWCKNYGKGRVFYTALGHAPAMWDTEWYQQHLLGAIRWALDIP